MSATNVSQFAQPKKHHRQQCVRNNVSSFTRALRAAIVANVLEELASSRGVELQYLLIHKQSQPKAKIR